MYPKFLNSTLITLLFSFLIGLGAEANFLSLFPKSKPLIAAIMVDTDIKNNQTKQKNINWSLEQLKIAENNGLDGILIEFRGGGIQNPKLEADKLTYMNEVMKKIVSTAKIAVGVEILWHYPEETLKLAKDSGATFVRVDFFSDKVIADGKPVNIDPDNLLKFKQSIKAENVYLLTDIQVKYSEMVDKKITITQSAELAEQKGSQGVIVTSSKSGTPPEPTKVDSAKKGIKNNTPIIIGSGFSKESAKNLLKFADAVIVGTSISEKTGGPLVPSKVKELVETVDKIRNELKNQTIKK